MFYLTIYLATLIITFGVRKINKLIVINDISNYEAKINDEKLSSLSKNISLFNLKNISYEHFIPFYNVIKTIFSMVDYINYSSYYYWSLFNFTS